MRATGDCGGLERGQPSFQGVFQFAKIRKKVVLRISFTICLINFVAQLELKFGAHLHAALSRRSRIFGGQVQLCAQPFPLPNNASQQHWRAPTPPSPSTPAVHRDIEAHEFADLCKCCTFRQQSSFIIIRRHHYYNHF